MKLTIEELQFFFRTVTCYNELHVKFEGIDNVRYSSAEGKSIYVNREECYFISVGEDFLRSILEIIDNDKCIIIDYVGEVFDFGFPKKFVKYQFKLVSKYLDYFIDVSIELKKFSKNEITKEYIKKFSNAFVNDSILLTKWGIKSTDLGCYVANLNEDELQLLIDDIIEGISKRII